MTKNLIEELGLIMKQKDISPEHAARYIGCSFKQVYRWLEGESMPSMIYRKAIRRGIERMKKLAEVSADNTSKDRDLYRQLKKQITLKEKNWLLNFDDDYNLYRKKLKKLVAKYNVPIEENVEK